MKCIQTSASILKAVRCTLQLSCHRACLQSEIGQTSARQIHTSVWSRYAEENTEQPSSQESPHDLKTALRRLYKLVHPDLFSDNLTAKAENERSFKLLQEYLHHARVGDPQAPVSRTPYHFTFYLRDQAAETAAAAAAAAAAGPGSQAGSPSLSAAAAAAAGPSGSSTPSTSPSGSTSDMTPGSTCNSGRPASQFYVVDLLLPPPARHISGSKELSRTAKSGLAKLLRACGLSADFAPQEGGQEPGEVGPASLAAFLPEAMEAVRKAQAGRVDPGVRVANLRGAFRLGRQLVVSLHAGLPPARQVKLLEQLARILDTHPDLELRGCHISIGPAPSGIDRRGVLCLHEDEGEGDWQELLTQVDVTFVLERMEYVQGIKQLERSVSRALGVAQVYSTPDHSVERTYLDCLNRLAGHASEAGRVMGGQYADVPLMILPGYARHHGKGSPSGQPLEGCCQLDSDLGLIQVTDDSSAADIYACIAKQGQAAQLSARVRCSRESELARLVERVRGRLRLRHLLRDSRLAPHHFERACKELLERSDALQHVLEGGSLRVGFVNRVAPDGSCVEIAWDFKP